MNIYDEKTGIVINCGDPIWSEYNPSKAFQKRLRQKHWNRQKRRNAAKHKADERLRTASYQRKIDMIARGLKRKGKGRAHKIKGETMPSIFPTNSNCAKS